ncbi:MAG: leucine-rich repeat domain-containing protein [Bacteroidota bacterium]|nr:leucine-rich repeat domain-containing protein [Bacteroidota bacterium]
MKIILNKLFLSFLLLIQFSFTQPDANTYYESGVKSIKSKDYIKAIGDFTNAVSMRANYAEAYLQRAKAKILLGEQMGFVNSEACGDLVMAMRYGNKEAVDLLEKNCMGECFDSKLAFDEPDMVYCGDFSNKVLYEIPTDVSKLVNVVKISLFNNKLTKLSERISPLYTLISLDVSSNKITEVSPEISKLNALRELNLSKNLITELPYEFGNLTELRFLNLRSNMLAQLPKSVARCKNLQVLDLSLNKLTTLPIEVATMKSLKELNLVGNDIPKDKQAVISSLLPNTKIYFE